VTKPKDDIAKFDLRSEDVAEARRLELLRIFPEAHTESGGINFEALRLSLGDAVQTGPESFGMSWPGKAECAKTIQRQSVATLLPIEEESVNWDTTQNVIIEGDNLEVLKVLQKAYLGKVKMIYIDPPYNTGNDFIYPDNYTESLKTYLQFTGQINDEGRKFSTNTESSGRFHSKWMNMMYTRLGLARNLLREDGVIFISIDDSELTNLLQMCDSVFGEANKVGCMPTVMNMKGNNDQFGFAGTHEYTVVYAFDLARLEELGGIPLTADDELEYSEQDEFGRYKKGATLMRTGEAGAREKRPRGYYPIYVSSDLQQMSLSRASRDDIEVYPVTRDGREMSWRRSPETLGASLSEFLITGTKSSVSFYKKQRLEEDRLRGKKPKSLLYKPEYSSGNGTEQVKSLFNGSRVFDNPKPKALLIDLIRIGCPSGGLVLDFFAGSGTTAHAAIEVAEAGLKVSFLMVQLPEKLEQPVKIDGHNLESIFDLMQHRIRKVILNSNLLEQVESSKVGFRSFKLTESNFVVWDASAIEGDESKLEQQLFAQVEHVLSGRTNQDILFELMLKSRYELTTPVERLKVGKCEVWKVAGGEMVTVIDAGLTVEVIRAIASWKPVSVVILDRCFGADDSLKANARKIFEDSKVDLKTV